MWSITSLWYTMQCMIGLCLRSISWLLYFTLKNAHVVEFRLRSFWNAMPCFLKFSTCNFKMYDSSPPLTSKGIFFHGPSPCANYMLSSKLMLLTQPTIFYERPTLVKLTSYHMFFVELVKPMQGKWLKKWVKWYK